MRNTFFIVGPTASGKSDLAADVAINLDAEVVSADAFQIYRGLDLLAAKPDGATLAKVPHHLIDTLALDQEMNAERFRSAAVAAISEINSRGKLAIVAGGSGLYVKALTHGLSDLPGADAELRRELDRLSLEQLRDRLRELDPATAAKIDVKNRRRLVRAIEVCVLTGKPISSQRTKWDAAAAAFPGGKSQNPAPVTAASTGFQGVFVFRDRDDLYRRINDRVERIFGNGVIEEVRAAKVPGETASKMIGWREIQDLIAGRTSTADCMAAIQQATRRYAKRQLTWFRRQPSLEPLNLSHLSHGEAVKWITQLAKAFGARAQG